MNLKLIGAIHESISTPALASNTLAKMNGMIQLLREAVFVAESFDVGKLLDSDQDQVIYAF